MKTTIVFIHGMFQNPKSWDKWIAYFESKGYNCVAPAWPMHEGLPRNLRTTPPEGLGDLRLQTIIDELEDVITSQKERPILIGHSVGGLIVQLFIHMGIGEMGVAINSVAPNAMLSFDWNFIKNSALIANPFKGNEPFYMNVESFHELFCNTMSMEESERAYNDYATHGSRNVLRDCMGDAGRIDLDMSHAPLLFVGGSEDQIIPPSLNKRNAEAYNDDMSIADFIEFSDRGHFICGQPGWREVAGYIENWLEKQHELMYHEDSAM